jgi:hypothetical protein
VIGIVNSGERQFYKRRRNRLRQRKNRVVERARAFAITLS